MIYKQWLKRQKPLWPALIWTSRTSKDTVADGAVAAKYQNPGSSELEMQNF